MRQLRPPLACRRRRHFPPPSEGTAFGVRSSSLDVAQLFIEKARRYQYSISIGAGDSARRRGIHDEIPDGSTSICSFSVESSATASELELVHKLLTSLGLCPPMV